MASAPPTRVRDRLDPDPCGPRSRRSTGTPRSRRDRRRVPHAVGFVAIGDDDPFVASAAIAAARASLRGSTPRGSASCRTSRPAATRRCARTATSRARAISRRARFVRAQPVRARGRRSCARSSSASTSARRRARRQARRHRRSSRRCATPTADGARHAGAPPSGGPATPARRAGCARRVLVAAGAFALGAPLLPRAPRDGRGGGHARLALRLVTQEVAASRSATPAAARRLPLVAKFGRAPFGTATAFDSAYVLPPIRYPTARLVKIGHGRVERRSRRPRPRGCAATPRAAPARRDARAPPSGLRRVATVAGTGASTTRPTARARSSTCTGARVGCCGAGRPAAKSRRDQHARDDADAVVARRGRTTSRRRQHRAQRDDEASDEPPPADGHMTVGIFLRSSRRVAKQFCEKWRTKPSAAARMARRERTKVVEQNGEGLRSALLRVTDACAIDAAARGGGAGLALRARWIGRRVRPGSRAGAGLGPGQDARLSARAQLHGGRPRGVQRAREPCHRVDPIRATRLDGSCEAGGARTGPILRGRAAPAARRPNRRRPRRGQRRRRRRRRRRGGDHVECDSDGCGGRG